MAIIYHEHRDTLGKNNACEKNTFLLDYTHNARAPGVKDKIVDMAMNGSGVRDTARVLRISINTVIGELKKG
ncbi:IS1-like element transposase [Candidiatus Paracoxiella cheracis]|uniref:IS1-like element transposase n=1 Tax=Candidiatus Paracoxiella cheracis TaxID=3405120 RepID=UPI003BF5DEAB